MAAHELSVGASDEWYTPPWLFDALRIEFETDSASPGADVVPWIPAKQHSTLRASVDWHGPVWLNPPYGGRWMSRKLCVPQRADSNDKESKMKR